MLRLDLEGFGAELEISSDPFLSLFGNVYISEGGRDGKIWMGSTGSESYIGSWVLLWFLT